MLFDPGTIVYAHFDGVLVTIVTALRSLLTTLTLRELEERLPQSFERVDRRHLLNLDEVAQLVPESDGGYVAVTRRAAHGCRCRARPAAICESVSRCKEPEMVTDQLGCERSFWAQW